MKQITVDSSLNKLSTEALTVQIGSAELTLASFFCCIKFLLGMSGKKIHFIISIITLHQCVE